MEAALRFSQNSPPNGPNPTPRFLHVDVSGKHFQLCQITSRPTKRTLKYEPIAASGPKVPAFRAFDWHPTLENLVVVGQAGGEATLLNLHPVDDTAPNAPGQGGQPPAASSTSGVVESISFNVRSQRPSNAVSLSSQHLLAAGLDRVRTDFCLNIWDFTHRLPSTTSTSSLSALNFSKAPTSASPEPLHKLAPGEPITSLKFFSSSPSLLVAGVKGQFVRLYDLRDPAATSPSSSSGSAAAHSPGANSSTIGGGLQFPTRCVHNLAIDPRDENYFASCFPTGDTMVCIWDRRMGSRPVGSSSFGGMSNDNRNPEVSLELKNTVDSPGSIWSLRFAKSTRGCLGVLSSTGHLKVFEIGKDFAGQDATYQVEPSSDRHAQHRDGDHADGWDSQMPQDVHFERAQDIGKHVSQLPSQQDDKARIVSFDFMTTATSLHQPEIITLAGNGEIRTTSPAPLPEPSSLSSTGFFINGHSHYVQESFASKDPDKDIATAVRTMHAQAEPHNTLWKAFKGARSQSQPSSRSASPAPSTSQTPPSRLSSLSNNLWHTDLGFYESIPITASLPNLLTLTSIARHRCKAGYLISPTVNRDIVSDSKWLQSLWTWIDRAQRISKNGRMVADNLDLAYLGVFSLWMEDIPEVAMRVRTLGPGPTFSGGKRVSKAIESLVRGLNLPVNRGSHTEYKLYRQLCLHVSGLSWSSAELESWTKRLVQQGQHTKAAFVALVAAERSIAHKVLKAKKAGQRERMLGVAIAGAARRAKRTTPTQSRRAPEADSESDSDMTEDDEAWSGTISSLSADLTDPYARAILAYVKSNDWSDVLREESLPLKYRVCVALRHLDDSKLTRYISQTTKDAISEGDIEGVVLTGTGTKEGFELMEKYVTRIGDLQSAVLALATTVPRYVNEESIVRRYEAWKQAYRGMMNSWGCRMERVRFDVAMQKAAIENGTGRRLIKPAKPQVKLVCSYCAGSVAHHEAENGEGDQENGTKTHDTARNPLTPATAAAMGTVCPKCGRKLPRCGVCDMWLGVEDNSYLRWYGQKKTESAGSADLSGSAHTTIGPGGRSRTDSPATGGTMAGSKKGSTGSADAKVKAKLNDEKLSGIVENAVEEATVEDAATEKVRKLDEMMSRFTVFCVKCSHAFHAAHARRWFQGSPEEGRTGHQICPVPRCECVCYE